MKVDPVQPGSAGIDRQTPGKNLHIAQPQRSADSGNSPETEISATENIPTPPSPPEHEVKVQLDTPADGILIYQILDKKSGSLVMQVPSAEQIRNIHQSQELLQRIAARATTSTSDEAPAPVVKGEGSNNGNKL